MKFIKSSVFLLTFFMQFAIMKGTKSKKEHIAAILPDRKD